MTAFVKSSWESGRLVYRRVSDAGGVLGINPSRVTRFMSVTAIVTDDDTLTAAAIKGGIITYVADNNGGTLTFDTGANIDTAFPSIQTGECIEFYICNLGGFTATLAADGGSTVTLLEDSQVLAINEGMKVVLRRTGAGTYTVYTFGGSSA